MFKVLDSMGFPMICINLIKLLFNNAKACVKVNNTPSKSFTIEREVRQGCPLAPYLFIILADVLNIMVQAEGRAGRIKGIILPMRERQQILAQYADDTSITLLGEEGSVRNLIYMLKTFCLASLIGPNPVGTGKVMIHYFGRSGLTT